MMESGCFSHGNCIEYEYLNKFISHLAVFAYDKIKILTESTQKCNVKFYCSEWPNMMACLNKLVINEKAYTSFIYLGCSLGQKLFSRKDTLKTSYESLIQDFKKVSLMQSFEEGLECEGNMICSDTSVSIMKFISLRILMIKLYENTSTLGIYGSSTDFSLMDQSTSVIIQELNENSWHRILAPLRRLVDNELHLLRYLFICQVKVQSYQFIDCLVNFGITKRYLINITKTSSYKEQTRKLGFVTTSNTLPAFLQWFTDFYKLLVSKFTLYYYEILKKQANKSDFNKSLGKVSIDFYSKLINFYKKSDASSVSILLNVGSLLSHNSKLKFSGLGYKVSSNKDKNRQGLDNYPAIMSHPPDKADRYWPDVVSILNDNNIDTSNKDKIIYFLDERRKCTYFLILVERHMSIVVIYECKKSDKDTYIVNNLNQLAATLRCSSVFYSMLKPSK